MPQMCPGSDVKPNDPFDVFRFQGIEERGVVSCEIGPVIFLVPERASAGGKNLYVGVKGRVRLIPLVDGDRLRMTCFSTSVGYFRSQMGKLEHVFGIHYDMDESRFGHPVFHGQIAPQLDFVDPIKMHFRGEWNVCDRVGFIMRNVRVPSAEMDVFSVFLQICADHLIDKYSGRQARSAFSRMRDSCGLYLGAAERVSRLIRGIEEVCFRGSHWY